MSSEKPILVIDDEPEQVRGILLELTDEAEVLHPDDLKDEHLHAASLLLVDHHLDDANWPKRSHYPLTCQPRDGLALAAIFQSHLRIASQARPVAVALLSGQLTEVTGLNNPPEHIAARACGLDWAFAKAQNPVLAFPLPARIRSFAKAVRALPQPWPTEPNQSHQKLTELLGIQNAEWAGIALLHVDRCHPPVHEPAFWTHGTALLRWLAQQILPYRTFLLDRNQLAIRLGVTPRWLGRNLSAGSPLLEAITDALYRGILRELMGERWWIAGIDTLLWNVTDGGSVGVDEVRNWLKQHTGEEPEPLSSDETLILNEDLCFDGSTAPYVDCVKVWPDDWPAFAEVPWTTVALARATPRLGALVMASDMDKLVTDEA
jgi:hypothetical protein